MALHACELLSCIGPCVAKRMFGGWGISTEGMTLAIIAYDTLFMKANDETAAQWEAAGGEAFEFEARGKKVRTHYYTPPAEALESPALMLPWARLALTAAVAARAKPARKVSAKKAAVKKAAVTKTEANKASAKKPPPKKAKGT